MGVPYSIFCCFKSTTNARLIDLEAGGGGSGTYSTDVNSMLASADNTGIRTSIGLGTASSPTFLKVIAYDATNSVGSLNGFQLGSPTYTGKHGLFSRYSSSSEGWTLMSGGATQISGTVNWPGPWVTQHIGFSPTSGGIPTSFLWEDAPGVLGLRNGSSRQSFRVYNTYTSATVFERAVMGWNATTGNLDIGTEFLGGSGMAAKQIDFVTGGAVRMSIAAAGNVGIGTTTPASGLHISGALGGDLANSPCAIKLTNTNSSDSWVLSTGIPGVINGSFSIRGSNGSLTALAINTTGNVGLGTNSPGARLHSVSANQTLTGNVTDATAAGKHQIAAYTSDTAAIDKGASIGLGGYYETLNAYATYGAVAGRKQIASNNNTLGYLSFLTNVGGVGLTEKMRISSEGNVGIGTTNPVADLDIADTWNAPALAVTGASGTGTTATLNFATQLTEIPIGSTIVVAGVTPAGYNGTYVVTASTTSTVLYANATTGAGTGGTIERVFTSVKLNVTDTASNAASKLMDLQVGGSSIFKVDKTGRVSVLQQTGANYNVPSFGGTEYSTGISIWSNSRMGLISQGVGVAAIQSVADVGLMLKSDYPLSWSSALINGASTTFLYQDAAGILAQKNLGTRQTFRLYNATDVNTPNPANYDRAVMEWTSGAVFRIGTENAGSYTLAKGMEFITGGAVRMSIDTSGNITGTPGTTIGGSSVVSVIGAGNLRFSGRSAIYSPADGKIALFNQFSTGFNLLTLGGITSAEPAIKRVGTELQVVIASTAAAINVAAVDADMTFIQDRFRRKGAGTPEGAVTAPVGAVYHRTDSGAHPNFYVKESGSGFNGWVGK